MLKNYNKIFYLKVSEKVSLLIFAFHLLNLEINSQDYADVFTCSIYEQDDTVNHLTSLHMPEDKIDEELVKSFLKKKEEALEESFSKGIRKEIQFLSTQYTPILEKMLWDKLLLYITEKMVVNSMPSALMGTQTSQNIVFLTRYLGQKTLEENFSGPIKELIGSRISDLTLKMQRLKNGLQTEPVLELEKAYIKRKRKMTDTTLKREIENGFLGLRKTDYYLGRTIQKTISYALKLPIKRKVHFDTVASPTARQKLLEEIEHNPLIRNYDENLRGELRDIITNISDIAAHPDSTISHRRSYIFQGNPSCGKTRAAREIPEILRLPYYEITIQDPSEVTKENLEGLNALWPNASPGWFASALMASSDGEEPAKNSILIINDLDRIDMKTNPGIYSFLLAYLDPGKKTYYNPFFETEIDISHLIVILTVNNPLCSQPAIQDEKPEALLTRLSKTVIFPDFSESKKRELVSAELQKLKNGYSVLKPFNFEYQSSSPARISLKVSYNADHLSPYSPDFLSPIFRDISEEMSPHARALNGLSFPLHFNVSGSTLRQLIDTGILSSSISAFVNKLTSLSSSTFAQAQQGQNVRSLTPQNLYLKSAICGHEEAILHMASQPNIDENEMLFWLEKGVELKQVKSVEELGGYYDAKGEKEKARDCYSKAFLLGSDAYENWLANYVGYANKYEELAHLSKLYKRKPTSTVFAEKIYQLGDYFLGESQFEKALDCFRLIADLDKPKHYKSLVRVAKKIEQEKGLGDAKALALYKEAADGGDFEAAYRIGISYRDFSDGKSRSYSERNEKALEWFRRAAIGEHPEAQYQLGIRYQDVGILYRVPDSISFSLLGQALTLIEMPLRLTYDLYLGNDDKQSADWFLKAANNGHPGAQYHLGERYRYGKGLKLNYSDAYFWLKKSAEQGNPYAQALVGEMHEKGLGTTLDYEKSIAYYNQSATQNNSWAQYQLGRMHELGIGVSKDKVKALDWYTQADIQGFPGAADDIKRLQRKGWLW